MTAGMAVLSVAVTALVLATEEHHHADEDAPVVSQEAGVAFVGVTRSSALINLPLVYQVHQRHGCGV